MYLRQFFDPHLAQYAYLVGCQRTGEALLIDPLRDVDQYHAVAAENDLRVTAVVETHIHADFVSGAAELAADPAVRVLVSAEGGPDWQSEWVNGRENGVRLKNGDVFRVGGLEFRALHTPGHTPEHMSYLVTDRGGGADEPMAAFTGDFIFVGDVGRPDLLESAAGVAGAMEPSARRLYHSLREFAVLPEWLQILPAHGAGSACGKALGAVPATTLGYEKRFNSALSLALTRSEDDFVAAILEGQPEPPAYFATMKRVNKIGSPVLGAVPQPPRMSMAEVVQHASNPGVVVLDTRGDRAAWLHSHLRGSLHTPPAKFSDFAGSWLRPDEGVILLLDDVEEADGWVRQLIRMGFDLIKGVAAAAELDGAGAALTGTPVATFSDLPTLQAGADPPSVLDVRRASEFKPGHIRGAQNIAHTRLRARLDEVPADRPLAVHCQSGVRAVGACSLLERSGRIVICLNDAWTNCPESLRG
ncbi:MAG: MBL fold metallo-hydrolase [Verrucomicrobiales bacterium]